MPHVNRNSWSLGKNFFLTFLTLEPSIYNGMHEHVYMAHLPQAKISTFQEKYRCTIIDVSKGEKVMYWHVTVYETYQYMDYEHKIHTECNPVFTVSFETSSEAEEFAADMRQDGYQTAVRLG